MKSSAETPNRLGASDVKNWSASGERVDAQGAPVSGGSYRYAYDGIGRPSDFIAWPES